MQSSMDTTLCLKSYTSLNLEGYILGSMSVQTAIQGTCSVPHNDCKAVQTLVDEWQGSLNTIVMEI